MSWATLTATGRVAALYGREASALLNSRGRPVVAEPPGPVVRDWRWDGEAWTHDPVPDPNAVRQAAKGWEQLRREGYAATDRDLMFEVACEVALALAAEPEIAALLRPSTRSKAAALAATIAAVKAEHPKES